MALISNIKHGKGKLARYYTQAKKLFRGSLDGDRKSEVSDKAKVPREIPNAPITIITIPAAAMAITGAHVDDTEVVPNEGYDYDYWAWNELPPTPSEPPPPSNPSTASATELKGQEPTVDNGDNILLAIASIGDSITRILGSASDSSSSLLLGPTITTTTTAAPTLSSYSSLPPISSPSLSSISSPSFSPIFFPPFPSPPKRFQRSPFFGKKIGVTPRVSRIPSVLGALDPKAPAFESPVSGLTLVGGSDNELEGYGEDEESTLIEPGEGGFETFGGVNGGRPYLADIQQALGQDPSLHPPRRPRRPTDLPPNTSMEESFQRAFELIRELRGYLGGT